MCYKFGMRCGEVRHSLGDIEEIEGLGNNLLAASSLGGTDGRANVIRRHGDDWHLIQRWIGAELEGDFPPINARHTEIEQYHCGAVLAGELYGFVSI
jgi:hypothetical protein